MNTRRSKRLSKTPVPIESDSDDSVIQEKKQKLIGKTKNNKGKDKKLLDDAKISSASLVNDSYKNGHDHSSLDSRGRTDSGSDSDSSVDYMKSPNAIDLNSDFFKVDFKKPSQSSEFSSIENKIFSDVKQLSESGSSSEEDSAQIPYYEIPIPQMKKLENVESGEIKLDTGTKDKKINKAKGKGKGRKSANKELSVSVKQESDILNEMDVSQLLAMGETQSHKEFKFSEHITISEDEMSDWEEVQVEIAKEVKQENHSFPKEGVQITLDAPDIYQKRKKKGFDMAAFVKRRVNRIKREQQILVHKVHLLCWIGHGLYVNSVLNSEMLMGLSLSLIPSQHSYPKKVDVIYLKKLVGWFIKTVPVVEKEEEKKPFIPLVQSLQKQFECSVANSSRDLVLMFVCLLRSLGLTVRLIISLQPVRLKPASHELCDIKDKKEKDDVKCEVKSQNDIKKNVKKEVSSKKGSESKSEKKETTLNKGNEVKAIVESASGTQGKVSKKKSSRGKNVRVLSPDDARRSNKQVMSKEEALKRIKAIGDDVPSSSDAKKLKVTPTKNSACVADNPRRSFREKKKDNIRYKDASSSSDNDSDASKETRSPLKSQCQPQSCERDTKSFSKGMKASQIEEISKSDIKNKSKDIEKSNSIVSSGNSKKSSTLKSNNKKIDENPSKTQSNNSQNNLTIKCSKNSGVIENNRLVSEKSSEREHSRRVYRRGQKPMGRKGGESSEPLKNEGEVSANCKIGNKNHDKDNSTLQTSDDEFIPGPSNSTKLLKKKNGEKKSQDYKPKKTGSESDFEEEITNKVKLSKRNSKNGSEIDRRVLSSDSENSEESEIKFKNDFWTEVLIDSQEWVPISVVTGDVNDIEKIRRQATKPITYVVGWNTDLTLKDVTCRYCKQFHSVTRKQRIDEKWWKETLFPFLSSNTAQDKKEDEHMQKQIQDQPLPTSIAEYKNHPLYVLKRHLLKFQAIYPPNSPTLGFVKGEAVYPRDCVYTLHSRDIWLKEAKVVRLGEQPYKVVKARPKWDRMSGKVITDLPLEIFGMWQVEDYVPPTAVDGKVPRNAYGNVELFKPSMLPKGTVHLQVPGLNRVAKKLQIDCAPAVVGFDFHCGASHPMYDGFVVCEEFQDVLLDAWNRDQEEAEKREIEKREKRVYGNWRRLIKGLLIRERLKIKYAFGEGGEKASTSKGKKAKKSKAVAKKSKGEDEDTE